MVDGGTAFSPLFSVHGTFRPGDFCPGYSVLFLLCVMSEIVGISNSGQVGRTGEEPFSTSVFSHGNITAKEDKRVKGPDYTCNRREGSKSNDAIIAI